MNDSGSITEFFYNIVPGSLFLFVLNLSTNNLVLEHINIDGDKEAVLIFYYIIGGLFVGFFFQCLTKIIRHEFWNESIFELVKVRNKEEFNRIRKKLKIKPQQENKIFYLADNSLRGEKAAFLPTHFSSRFAFWANIAWGSLILIILSFVYPLPNIAKIALSLILLFSTWMAHEHLDNFYDTILKSYYMKCRREL